MGKRTIHCTPENAKEFQALVKRDAGLLNIVQQLQAQTAPDGRSMFSGLRCMSITIEGDEQTLAKGLGAWPVKSGAEAGKSEA